MPPAERRHRWMVVATTPAGLIGLVLTVAVIVVALLADVIAPYDPFAPLGPALDAPSRSHLLGTDDLGRDLFSGVVLGARTSLVLGLGVAAVVATIGIGVGLVSGYRGGLLDDVLMRITEAFQVLPRFFLAIVVMAMFGPGIEKLIIVLGLTSWAMVARIVRAETMSIREEEYVEASRSLGASDARIVLTHILPAVVPSTIAFVSLMVAQAILVEASLGFLGLSDPSVMSWGILAGNAQRFFRAAWWLAVFPGGAIALAVLGINMLGDGITAALGGRGRVGRGAPWRRDGPTAETVETTTAPVHPDERPRTGHPAHDPVAPEPAGPERSEVPAR